MKKQLTNKYKKEATYENVIQSLNNNLCDSQTELYQSISRDKTTVHIIGAPRSGTTLLSQIILSNLNVGYINNFIAAFWKAPLYGISLSKKLLGESYQSNLESDYGRTKNIYEPHEFGYFWKHQLNYNDFLQQSYNPKHNIDWKSFKEILYQMCEAFNKSMIFKSFLYGFHAEKAVKLMPNTIFLLIERDIIKNAFSILKFRKKVFGDINFWASIKPYQYELLKNENVYRQVIGQIYCLNHEYRKQLSKIPRANKMIIKYEDFCKNSNNHINEIYNLIKAKDNKITYKEAQNLNQTLVQSQNVYNEEELVKFSKAQKWFLQNKKEFLL